MKERFIQSASTLNVTGDNAEYVPERLTLVRKELHNKLNAQILSELWGIGPIRAKETLNSTTHNGIIYSILPLSRRYRSDIMYNVKRLRGKFASDTFYAK